MSDHGLCLQTQRATQASEEPFASSLVALGLRKLPVLEHLSHWLYLAPCAGMNMDVL